MQRFILSYRAFQGGSAFMMSAKRKPLSLTTNFYISSSPAVETQKDTVSVRLLNGERGGTERVVRQLKRFDFFVSCIQALIWCYDGNHLRANSRGAPRCCNKLMHPPGGGILHRALLRCPALCRRLRRNFSRLRIPAVLHRQGARARQSRERVYRV